MGEFVRLVHIKDYDRTLKRFQSGVFSRSSSDHAVSVVRADCAEYWCGSICTHSELYYPTVSRNPVIFWRFDDSVLPSNSRLEQSPSNGDECHHNVCNLTKTQARGIALSMTVDTLTVCDDGRYLALTKEMVEAIAPGGANVPAVS